MLKIIHLSNPIGGNKGGGISAVIKDYMLYQNHKSLNLSLWFPGSNDFDKELIKYNDFKNKIRLIGLIGKSNAQKIFLRQIILELKTVNIIHQHSIWLLPSVLSLFFSKYNKGKTIIQPHGALAPTSLKRSSFIKSVARILYENSNLKNASMFIANSKIELDDIKGLFPSKKVALIPHGIPRDFLIHSTVNRPHFDSLIDGKKAILFLSRIHPIKGLDRFIEAVFLLNPLKIENVIFIIAGTGDRNYISYLEELIKKYELQRYFIFTGYANKEDKIALLDRCACFILPSLTESFSLSIVEAMARGLPVITTKGTPWSELCDRKCGFWIDNSTDGILEGLNLFLNQSEQEILEFGTNSKKLVIEKYILEDNISKYEELYRYVLGISIKPSFVY
jgi:glycosyltransferase involved in cell wall biosynthesis